MALEAMDISSSKRVVEFFPWPLNQVEEGQALYISARWARFNTGWLTLQEPGTKAERNFSVQGVLNKQGQNFVVLRLAYMDSLGQEPKNILARIEKGRVVVLSAYELNELEAQLASGLSDIFALPEPDRQRKCLAALEKTVGALTDWTLQEGPSFASFQISTTYQIDGRTLKSGDGVPLVEWRADAGEVFVRLKGLEASEGTEFHVAWLDATSSGIFVGLRRPSDSDDPDADYMTNVYLYHEPGSFEVASQQEILYATSRLFDAAEFGDPLDSQRAAECFAVGLGEV